MRQPDRIVRLKTVLSRTGLSWSAIYSKIAEGTFPNHIKISTNGAGWKESDINGWIASRSPGRPPKHDLTTWTVTDDWPDPFRLHKPR
ncbi:helix-turn-helix transcriptional regulator [Ochrobactrum sp. BTU1]|jgi:prophage regulatory protein|uniref:helix-turn-helix transcriptional regulator n=1 Tax=Ochrobactrum sp. BTU1 TaxID=2840456 RepID=UPI001C054B20|nr:AlpA family phage regulatory protein [Ochrobactrum sp. BTU1]